MVGFLLPQFRCAHNKSSRDWKKSNVTPIFKKDKKEEPGNYRPVSLTSLPGRVIEQQILATISRHIVVVLAEMVYWVCVARFW